MTILRIKKHEESPKNTTVTHNHPERLKGAEFGAAAIYLARQKMDKNEIKRDICANYYDISFTLDEIRDSCELNETCQGSAPQGLKAFFESSNFQDAIRNAISIKGNSDTVGATEALCKILITLTDIKDCHNKHNIAPKYFFTVIDRTSAYTEFGADFRLAHAVHVAVQNGKLRFGNM